ncbi:LOW QUALITY PROTEIN: uncharacterized protein LOC123300498 [Chrysoperla carnea]|uniref:LOW QUALITY PROTEIN: uncharacterized protein LOC123300498 n=1 Tax=Chrysoperla carnea TaxID=189513 RepID=UPI001D09714D|nr:LOW QUALITY PROTEIN: uncharacterized protein LOC123300498 [Chrysoperla carnea]
MFSKKEDLIRKTGEDGIGRLQYLETLVKEFNETKSKDAKKQILANLANFAYDPINYEYFRRLQIIPLFLDAISSSTDETIIYFSSAGLCNLCLDPLNQQIIHRYDGIKYILSTILNTTIGVNNHDETLLNCLTTLMYLTTSETQSQIIKNSQLKTQLEHFVQDSNNIRIKNLAQIFLTDYFQLKCTPSKIRNILNHNNFKQFSTIVNTRKKFNVGDKVTIGRNISIEDVKLFSEMTGDFNTIHFNGDKSVIHGAFLNGLVSGVIGSKLPGPGTLVVEQTLKFPNKCYVNDYIQITVELVEIKKIIHFVKYVCMVDEKIVLEGNAKLVFKE